MEFVVYNLFYLQDSKDVAAAPGERLMASCAVTFVGRLLSSLSLFTGRVCGGRSRSHFVTQSVSQSVTKTQMSHLETSNADSAQSKDVWNENLEFLMSSAVCLLSADCLLNAK